jgi:uncharacterized lipoprotein YddW (UPF0748 family)
LSEAAIGDRYRFGGGESERKWVAAIISSKPPSPPQKEARVLFDEDTHWVTSRLEVEKTIRRVKQAGFNVYIPCVWNGADASLATDLAPMSLNFKSARTDRYDPLRHLIEEAHREGIAVHLWFDVMRRETTLLPAQFSEGAPTGAFNAQSAPFRAYIVKLIRDAAERYDADGINLDYIRSMGACSSERCESEYHERYGRSLKKDWDQQDTGTRVPSIIEWNAAAVSSIVYDLAKQLREIKPRMFISVDTIPFDRSRLYQGVDVLDWIAKDAIDSVVYMAYETPIDIQSVTQAWQRLSGDKTVVLMRNFDTADDHVTDNTGRVSLDYVNLVRSQWPGAGVGFYHYPHLTSEQVSALRNGVFAVPVDSGWRRKGL